MLFKFPKAKQELYRSLLTKEGRMEALYWLNTILYSIDLFTFYIRDIPFVSVFFKKDSTPRSELAGISIALVILMMFSITIIIYSLLQMYLQTYVLELKVMRLLGFKSAGIVGRVMLEILIFSVPACIIGVMVGYVINYVMIGKLTEKVKVEYDRGLSFSAYVIVIIVGIGIPLVISTFFGVRILCKGFERITDTSKSETNRLNIILINFTRSKIINHPYGMLFMGLLLIGVGFFGFVLYPQSLLSSDITLFSTNLIVILILIMIGLISLSFNFEYILEKMLCVLLFCWENKTVSKLSLKNLLLHRSNNHKITIICSVLSGILIFIRIYFLSLTNEEEAKKYMENGADVKVTGRKIENTEMIRGLETGDLFELKKVVESYQDIIHSVGWSIKEKEMENTQKRDMMVSNIGHIYSFIHEIRGVNPLLGECFKEEYVKIISRKIQNSHIFEDLYMSDNGKSIILSEVIKKSLQLKTNDMLVLIEDTNDVIPKKEIKWRMNITGTTYTKSIPGVLIKKMTYSNSDLLSGIVSIPLFLSTMNSSSSQMKRMSIKEIFLRLKETVTHPHLLLFDETFNLNYLFSKLYNVEIDSNVPLTSIFVDYLSMVLTVVMMLICFVLILSSMHVNINKNQLEIKMLRCIGLSKFDIIRIYTEEVFILIMSAGVIGITIGQISGWLYTTFMEILKSLPLSVDFPWETVIVFVIMAIIISFFSTFFSLLSLMKETIAEMK